MPLCAARAALFRRPGVSCASTASSSVGLPLQTSANLSSPRPLPHPFSQYANAAGDDGWVFWPDNPVPRPQACDPAT